MRNIRRVGSAFTALLLKQISAQYSNASSAAGGSLSFEEPIGVSTTYSTTTFTEELADPTYLPQTDFSDERLGFLWDQVGPIATGIVTTTVSPTPEPSTFPNPGGSLHPYVPSYQNNLTGKPLPEGFIWGVASSAYQVEVRSPMQIDQWLAS